MIEVPEEFFDALLYEFIVAAPPPDYIEKICPGNKNLDNSTDTFQEVFDYFKTTHSGLRFKVKTSYGHLNIGINFSDIMRGLACCLGEKIIYGKGTATPRSSFPLKGIKEDKCSFKMVKDKIITDDISREDAERIFHTIFQMKTSCQILKSSVKAPRPSIN